LTRGEDKKFLKERSRKRDLTGFPKRCRFQSVKNEAEVIRALVVGVPASGMELTEYGSEADIAAAIQKRLQG